MKLGPFEIQHPFILAPMAGITHSPFRRLMRRRGSALVISELISANGLEYAKGRPGNRTEQMLQYQEDERILGLQIFGENEEFLCRASQRVEQVGADFVDLNLGCPVPKIVKKGAGSALCKDPKRLHQILKAMVDSVKIPVTIKIRTGWDAHTRNALEIVRAATDAGVAWVAIHGRTRAQGYSGDADWDFIGEVKAKSQIPIIGNGDIQTPEQAVSRYQNYGVDAVMIGRGALRNPFLFDQAESLLKGESYSMPTLEQYLLLLGEQKTLLQENWDDRMAMIQSRKFLSWYSAGYPGCHDFRKQVFSIEEPETLWKTAESFFEQAMLKSKNRDLQFMAQPFLMGGHG